MWEFGNFWTEGRNSASMASFHAKMHEIHVLLVDHESEALINTAKQLEMCQYRVTFVELASAAISMLLSGKAKFDVVMANINSPDLHGFKLLQHAVSMGLPVVLMSVDDNAFMAMRALENGAFLYIKKPVTMEILRCLWQHVLREKTRLIRERDMFLAANNHGSGRGNEFREMSHQRQLENPNVDMTKNKGQHKKKKARNGANDDEEYDSDNHMMMHNGNVRRKMCTEWTQELHAKFMDAVEQLGEGRCFPKDILEMMDVPGLTRMQVASHLQKCRNDNWRPPEERKPHQTTQPTTQDTNGSQHKPRRFGSKPQISKNHSGQAQIETQEIGRGSKTKTPNNGANMGNGSSMTNTSHRQNYGAMGSGPNNATPGTNSSSNHRHSSDEFFNFPDMDCLIQNLSDSGGQQGSGMNNTNPAQAAYQFDPAYNEEQNSGRASMETKSNWSSETSNFESDHSETRVTDG